MNLPRRKHIRLKDYDYSQAGAYFITVCTHDKKCILGQICVGPDDLIGPHIRLTQLGKCLEQALMSAACVHSNVAVQYCIMPNHFHAVITLSKSTDGPMGSSGPTLGRIVRGIKTTVSRLAGYSVWQDNYYEHVVRNEDDLLRVLDYMENNPVRWAEDEYFIAQES